VTDKLEIGTNLSSVLMAVIIVVGLTTIISGFSSCAEQEAIERAARYEQEKDDE
jgi:hypothetical protein